MADDAPVFHSKWLDPGEVHLRKLRGNDGISKIFELDVHIETTSRELLDPEQIDALVGGPAFVAFGEDDAHPFHGIVRAVELCEGSVRGRGAYRVELVPRLWDLTRTFRSRVYQDLSVPEIVAAVFVDAGLMLGDDFVLRLATDHPKREYTVQYQETDFAFVSRLLEYEGMFFFFEHGPTEEVVVVADSNYAFGEVLGHERVAFAPPSRAQVATRGITALAHRRSVALRTIRLVDYNYRTPSVRLGAEVVVDEGGHGDRLVYGEHFKTPDDGKRLATLRAEACRVERDVVSLASNLPALRVGRRFALVGHDFGTLNRSYVITEAELAFDAFAQGDAPARGDTFTVRLSAIPGDVPFRAPRTTPWPRVAGLCHGRVDGAQATSIDEHGRYKVILPFDAAASGTGRASRWIRMAQPVSGTASRMHFPLDVGTEVLLAHIDGDPDRPIIVGAVPNHETPSPVVARNAKQNVIATRTGIRMTFDDEAERS